MPSFLPGMMDGTIVAIDLLLARILTPTGPLGIAVRRGGNKIRLSLPGQDVPSALLD